MQPIDVTQLKTVDELYLTTLLDQLRQISDLLDFTGTENEGRSRLVYLRVRLADDLRALEAQKAS